MAAELADGMTGGLHGEAMVNIYVQGLKLLPLTPLQLGENHL